MPRQRIFVAGHRGMVGSAIVRALRAGSDAELVTRSRAELDLCNQAAVQRFFCEQRVDAVYLAAAKVGGILANNTRPADFIHDNLLIQCHVIHAAFAAGVKRLLFLGSSCIYPRDAAQPMAEEALLGGALEPSNEPYAIAKIAGIKLCESYNRQHGTDYRSVMPTNLYGPGDNFDLQTSHVVPALLRKFHEAAGARRDRVEVWGSGRPLREFMHVEDLASAALFVMNMDSARYRALTHPRRSHVNVGTGEEHSIAQLATLVARTVGFDGKIVQDRSKPDGAPRKLMDSSRLRNAGWRARYDLARGLDDAYRWFKRHLDSVGIQESAPERD